MNKWILGARPRTLPAAIAPVVVGVAIAYPKFDFINALLALIVGLALQIGVNYANDYSDGVKGTDSERIGPTRLVASGLANAHQVKRAAFTALGLGAVAGLGLAVRTSWWLIAIGVLAILAAWGYTGGKNPYGYKGYGEVFVFIFFGLVATMGTFYGQTKTLTGESLMAAISTGATACALLAVNNIRDLENDALVGKRTLAVRMGDVKARKFYSLLIFISVITAFTITLLAVLAIFPALKLFVDIRLKKGRELISVLGATGRLQLFLGLLLAIGAILNF